MNTGLSGIRQRGVVLLVMLAVLLLGSAFFLVQRLNLASEAMLRDETTEHALAEARAVLLGWALGHPGRPGMLPYPDRNADGNYDGSSDCPSGALASNMLLGRLPWLSQTSPCVAPLTGVGVNVVDGAGERLWYAVSRNLLYQPSGSGYPAVSPALLNVTTQWLTVLDGQGNTLSNRVAAVLLAPGAPLRGQNRAAAAPAAANYLDSASVGGVNYSNADFDGVFIAAPAGDDFNDRLIYVTADELVTLAERRVLRQAQQCLRSYAALSGGKLPWAAQLNPAAAPDYGGDYGASFGRIPTTLNVNASPGTPDAAMPSAWTAGCFASGTYWDNWREFMFYEVAPGFQPGSVPACPTCLSLNGSGNMRAVVLAAGRELAGQVRVSAADKGTPANYLEGDNATAGDRSYESRAADTGFNDQMQCVGAAAVCQ